MNGVNEGWRVLIILHETICQAGNIGAVPRPPKTFCCLPDRRRRTFPPSALLYLFTFLLISLHFSLFLSPSSRPSYTRIFTALHVTVRLHIFAVSHARTPSCGWTKSGWAIPGDLMLHRFPWSYCIVMILLKWNIVIQKLMHQIV